MIFNPYWVGFVCALSRYPGVQRLARMAQERERERLRRERLSASREGVLESGLCPPGFIQMATAQQAREIGKALEETRKNWDHQLWRDRVVLAVTVETS